MYHVILNDYYIVATTDDHKFYYLFTTCKSYPFYDQYILKSTEGIFDSSTEFNFCKDDEIIKLNGTNNIIFVYNNKLYYSINDCLIAIIIDEHTDEVHDILFNKFLQ